SNVSHAIPKVSFGILTILRHDRWCSSPRVAGRARSRQVFVRDHGRSPRASAQHGRPYGTVEEDSCSATRFETDCYFCYNELGALFAVLQWCTGIYHSWPYLPCRRAMVEISLRRLCRLGSQASVANPHWWGSRRYPCVHDRSRGYRSHLRSNSGETCTAQQPEEAHDSANLQSNACGPAGENL